ncbi:hypothetical protein GCM10007420_21610 [Glycocaulis albus]|uniref:Uncharacterized protein n=1 Tax=Glycocaulis albus TaxID=1382801 RepID=A0ABQ1XW05_9PROT|nr:hypothetical protein [Glycocaulis albus]GGH04820.1 hypothetical protein GCM10007420_21610 [Glycocaulis albus]
MVEGHPLPAALRGRTYGTHPARASLKAGISSQSQLQPLAGHSDGRSSGGGQVRNRQLRGQAGFLCIPLETSCGDARAAGHWLAFFDAEPNGLEWEKVCPKDGFASTG